MKKNNYLFVEREKLSSDDGVKELAKGCFYYVCCSLFITIMLLLCLWCCSCSTPQESIVRRDFDGYMEFNYDNVVGYDADRNIIYYLVIDTVKTKKGNKIYHNVIEIDLCGVMIEDLEQGVDVYIDQKSLHYD